MSLFATGPTATPFTLIRRALAAAYRRAFGFGALIAAALAFDGALFLATGLPTPLGALAGLLTVTVTTRSVIEGRDVSVLEGLRMIWTRRTAILATAVGGIVVGIPLLLIIGAAMAADPRAAAIVAAAGDRPLLGVIDWALQIATDPLDSGAAQALLFLGVGLWSAVCVHFLFVWQFTMGETRSGWAAMRASIPLVMRGYRRLAIVGACWALYAIPLLVVGYAGLITVAVGLYAPIMAGGEPALLFIAPGLLLMFATTPALLLGGWYLLAQLFVELRAQVDTETTASDVAA